MENAFYNVVQLKPDQITPAIAADLSALTSQLCGTTKVLSEADVRRLVQAHFLAVAVVPGTPLRIVGMACLVLMDLPQGRRTLIESVAVHEDCRRQGIGRALMQALTAEAARHGAGPLSLTCNPRRPEARRLYESLGFAMADTAVYRRPLAS